MRSFYIPIGMAKKKKILTIISVGEDTEQLALSMLGM